MKPDRVLNRPNIVKANIIRDLAGKKVPTQRTRYYFRDKVLETDVFELEGKTVKMQKLFDNGIFQYFKFKILGPAAGVKKK